ncbi:MAG: hypothetical protein ACRYFX_18600 [Janthinobacterium lividum]
MRQPAARQPRELLDRISHALVGHASIYLNTRWGEAALEAYDELQPLRAATGYPTDPTPKRRPARRVPHG